jgi:hypothetical protein
VTSVTKRGDDTADAGRFLVRALVVIGGAAAVSAIAWLTATASASTVTEIANGPGSPAVVTAIDHSPPSALAQVTHSVPVVRHAHDAATPALAGVRDLSEAAAYPARLADVVETSVTHAVPGTVVAVRRIAGAATALTGPAAPAESTRDHVEPPPAGPDAARSDDAPRTPANSGSRERSAGRFAAPGPVRVAATEVARQLPADIPAEHGAGGLAGRSWLPSCVVPASAGFTSGHDRSGDDAVQPPAADHPQPSHRGNGAQHRAVTSAEIQPGVTPD